MLDPDPTNELCRGLIDPEMEAWLLANHYVYARREPEGDLVISKRPIKEALADFAKSLYSNSTRRQPQTGRHDPAQAALLTGQQSQGNGV